MDRWNDESSHPEIARRQLRDDATAHLMQGDGVVLYGGRGMGKSYLIRQLAEDVRALGATCFVLRPPSTANDVAGYLAQLASTLGITMQPAAVHPIEDVVAAWRAEHPEQQLVLLYDEVDGYVRDSETGARFFGSLESARKQSMGRVGILAAGGLGLVTLGRVWSSPFVNRAVRLFAPRFTQGEVRELAAPLDLGAYETEVLGALEAHSGNIPALCVRGLRGLYDVTAEARTPNRLLEVFEDFQEKHADFIVNLWSALGDGSSHDEPARVWRYLNSRSAVTTLREITTHLADLSPVAVESALTVLRAAGLVEGTRRGAFDVRLVASILSLPDRTDPPPASTLAELLQADLCDALLYIHRWGTTSYWRAGRLLPEAVFQAAISITLASRGWTDVVQESAQGGGRSDITAGHPLFPEEKALIEVKVWGRAGADDIQAQVERYRAPETTAIATAMLTVRRDVDLAEFQAQCLRGEGHETDAPAPLIAVANYTRATEWPALPVTHYLLKLPRGPKP